MAEKKPSPKPADKDVTQKKEEDKHLDRDGGERQPTDHSNRK